MSPLLDGLRILILEDELLIAMDIEQLCYDCGAREVTIMRDLSAIGSENIALSFDVAIVDLMLGGISTIDFAHRLKDEKIPFVFASGYSIADDLEDIFPGVTFVGKPYSGEDLIQAVADTCKRSSSQCAGDPIT